MDNHKEIKKQELNTHTNSKKEEINDYTTGKEKEIDHFTEGEKVELTSHTDIKKTELTTYTTSKKGELDTYNTDKKQELNTHTSSKKEEINNHVTTKELEIDQLVEGEKVELNSHTNIKKTELDKYIVDNRAALKGEKGDKGDTGKVSVVSKNDGITVNGNDIQLNTVDNLINTSITKPLSANQGVILDKQDKGVLGGYSGTFPLTTAVKEGIYLLPATNKFYVCIKNYNGTNLTAPNANFEELSVFQNRNKLENLKEYKVLFEDENLTLYKINENIGFVVGNVKIDFSEFTGGSQVGNLYEYYGNIGIPQEIYSKLYNYNFSMVTTYISNESHHSVIHHTFMGDGLTSPINNQEGVWKAEIGFLAPLVQDI